MASASTLRWIATQIEQMTLGLGVLFSLQGIPCLYYGTEQGLTGTRDISGNSALDSFESVREALWGKGAQAFDQSHPLFVAVQALGRLRRNEPPLSYGRLYFREVSSATSRDSLCKTEGR
jgi:glycosidase